MTEDQLVVSMRRAFKKSIGYFACYEDAENVTIDGQYDLRWLAKTILDDHARRISKMVETNSKEQSE